MRSPLFVESFSITTLCAMFVIGGTKRAIDARGLHEPEGEIYWEHEGGTRGTTSLAVLSLIFTFPLIFT